MLCCPFVKDGVWVIGRTLCHHFITLEVLRTCKSAGGARALKLQGPTLQETCGTFCLEDHWCPQLQAYKG